MTFSDPGFGIYVHWPFCKAKCPYCDFNSHVRHQGVDAMAFARALGAELSWLSQRSQGRPVSSIFFGGGTPSLMPPQAVQLVLDTISANWSVAPDAEVTLEANPTSVEAQHFAGYRAAGVNRVSVGVQALHDDDLKQLGRQHSSAEAIAAFRLAARTFPRVSFDLIYARPHQSAAAWRAELTRALGEQQGHMSLYQLTIEPGTAFGDLAAQGKFPEFPEERTSDLYEITQELTEKAGLSCYEISNHAATGHQSRHNLIYWRYGDYAGAGPGAHSRLGDGNLKRALVAEKHPEIWAKLVAAQGHGIVQDEALDPPAQALEYLLMGLRIKEGIDVGRFEALSSAALDRSAISELEGEGLVRLQGRRLAATARGRLVLNAIIRKLAA
jgi:oxygen-independent coproporphyrinogen-3 oxidase